MAEYKKIGKHNLFVKRTEKWDRIRHERLGLELALLYTLVLLVPVSWGVYFCFGVLWLNSINLLNDFWRFFFSVLILVPVGYLAIRIWWEIFYAILWSIVGEVAFVELTSECLYIKKLGITTKKIELRNISKLQLSKDPNMVPAVCILKNGKQINLGVNIKTEKELLLLEAMIMRPTTCTTLINSSISTKVVSVEKDPESLRLSMTEHKLSSEDSNRFLLVILLLIAYFF
jgi:hypothetical protein